MWLIEPLKPLLELATCKEYSMARKSTGNSIPKRSNKTTGTTQSSAPQAVHSVRKNVIPINLEDEIRRRAYEIYLERGSAHGDDQEDWLLAERQVRDRYQTGKIA